MKANFYSRVTFQYSFLENEAILNKEIIDDSMFGNQSNSILMIGKTDKDFDEISPIAAIINKCIDVNGNKIEKLFLHDESGDVDSWDFISNILTQEFDLDYSDDNQEMLIDSVVDACLTVNDYEPSSLGNIYISKEVLNIPKISRKNTSKINYFMARSMAHFRSEADFGKKPSSVSIKNILLVQHATIDWLDQSEVIAIAFKK